MTIHPEHSFGIWLHEFFHVVEAKARIRPTHGYYAKSRVHFPGWKGPSRNQLHYFRWQFRTTVRRFGWKAVTIDWAALYENGREVARDGHKGWSGSKKKDIAYRLLLRQRRPGATYTVRARMTTVGGTDSTGSVVFKKK